MRKHTTVDLDTDLVRQAAEALGTTRTIETIHAALAEVVRRRHRLALLDIETDLDLAELNTMRAHRFAEGYAPYTSEAPDATPATTGTDPAHTSR